MSGRAVALVWLFSRALVFATMLWTSAVNHHSIKWAMESWDTGHFVRISEQAYRNWVEVAFFPGLPMIMHAGHAVGVPPWITGTLLSLVCSALAAWALFRLGGGMAACWWLLAPMSVFTVVPYTEAPFAACAFWAWERARAGRWAQAALLAALGSTLRISGIFLVVALGVLALLTPGRRRPRLLGLAGAAGVTVAYFVYLHHITGDWDAWSHAQAVGWHRRGFSSPVVSFRRTLRAAQAGRWPRSAPYKHWVFRSEIASVALGVLATLYSLLRRWWAEATYIVVQLVAFTTSFWWLSVCRGVLIWFPLFLMFGTASARTMKGVTGLRRTWVVVWALVAVVTSIIIVFWSWLFFTRQWAG